MSTCVIPALICALGICPMAFADTITLANNKRVNCTVEQYINGVFSIRGTFKDKVETASRPRGDVIRLEFNKNTINIGTVRTTWAPQEERVPTKTQKLPWLTPGTFPSGKSQQEPLSSTNVDIVHFLDGRNEGGTLVRIGDNTVEFEGKTPYSRDEIQSLELKRIDRKR